MLNDVSYNWIDKVEDEGVWRTWKKFIFFSFSNSVSLYLLVDNSPMLKSLCPISTRERKKKKEKRVEERERPGVWWQNRSVCVCTREKTYWSVSSTPRVTTVVRPPPLQVTFPPFNPSSLPRSFSSGRLETSSGNYYYNTVSVDNFACFSLFFYSSSHVERRILRYWVRSWDSSTAGGISWVECVLLKWSLVD